MNTLKFQPIREKRQECYNLEDYESNEFEFDGNGSCGDERNDRLCRRLL